MPYLIFKFFVVFLSLLISCQSNPSHRDTTTIRLSVSAEPPTLDWNLATDNVSYQILNQLMEGLTQYNDNLEPIPAVAQSWEVSADGKTYTFYLNQNYKWSDGKPVRAQDFLYSWTRLLDPKTAAEYAYFLFDIKGAQEFNSGKLKDISKLGIKAINDQTLQVKLNKPVVFFPAITTFMVTYPLRRDVVEKYGDKWTDPAHMLTLGPYQLTEWWHDYRLKLAAQPYYGGSPKPYFKNIKIFVVKDQTTPLNLYETNALDVAIPPSIALAQYKNDEELISGAKLRGYYYGFNISKKPFNDVRIRQALAHALDKKPLPLILKGGERPTNSWIPPGMLAYNPDIGLEFNIAKAKALIKQAGYQSMKELEPITLSYNHDPTNKKIAEWAVAQWKQNLGLTVALDNQEWKSYLSQLKNDTPALFRLGWGADYPDPDNFLNLFTSYSGNNHTGFQSKAYDQLIANAAQEPNKNKRIKMYNQAQKIILEDQTILIPLFISTHNILVKKHLHPYPLLPVDIVYYKKLKPHPSLTSQLPR